MYPFFRSNILFIRPNDIEKPLSKKFEASIQSSLAILFPVEILDGKFLGELNESFSASTILICRLLLKKEEKRKRERENKERLTWKPSLNLSLFTVHTPPGIRYYNVTKRQIGRTSFPSHFLYFPS